MQAQPHRHCHADNPVHASSDATGTLWQWSRPGLEVRFCRDVVTTPQVWELRAPSHHVIVHLGGWIDTLETELEGRGGSSGPPLPGEVWTIPAERRYSSYLTGEMAEYAILSLSPTSLDTPAPERAHATDMTAVEGTADPSLHLKLLELARWHNAVPTSDLEAAAISSLVDQLRKSIRQAYSLEPLPQRQGLHRATLNAPQSRRLRRYLHAHLSAPLTLAELAQEARLGEHQLHRAFLSTFGTSPWQYLIRQRLRRAQHLLVATAKDITTIANETGFSSHSHLTTTFGRHVGCTPREYREATLR